MAYDCLLLQFLKEVPYSNEKEILRAPDKYASSIYSEDGKSERLKNLRFCQTPRNERQGDNSIFLSNGNHGKTGAIGAGEGMCLDC